MWFHVSIQTDLLVPHLISATFSGSWINSTWFALDASRGIEDPESKVFMRATVLVFDFLVYCPAVVLFTKIWQGNRSSRAQVNGP